MALDSSLCEIVLKIQKDPLKKVEGLTIGIFYQLKEHLQECEMCSKIIDEILETHKDVPEDPNSAWNRTKYN
jgi:hypothetical protein